MKGQGEASAPFDPPVTATPAGGAHQKVEPGATQTERHCFRLQVKSESAGFQTECQLHHQLLFS